MSQDKNKKLLSNLLSLTIAEAAGKGLTIFFTFYLARIIGPENYGIIGHAKSLVAYFTIFVVLGYDLLGVREVAQNPEKLRENVNTIFSLKFWFSLLSYLLLIVLVLRIDSFSILHRSVILLTGLNIFSLGLSLLWVYQGLERMKIVAMRSLLISIINFSGILIFIQDDSHTLLAVSIISVTVLLNTVWILFYYINEFGKIKIFFDYSIFRTLFKRALPLGIIFILATMYNNLDILLLGFLRSEQETGVYSIIVQLFILSSIILLILQNSFFPQLSIAQTSEDRIVIVRKFVIVVGVTIAFLAPMIFHFSDLLYLVVGESYVNLGLLAKFYSVKIFFFFIASIYYVPLLAWNKEKTIVYATLAGLIVNIPLNLILIPTYGIFGAASSSIFSELIVAVISIYIFSKTIETLYFSILIKIVFLLVLFFVIIYLMIYFGLSLIFALILSIIIYPILVFGTKILRYQEAIKLFK